MAVALLGLLLRPLSVVGMLSVVHLWPGLYRHPGEWPKVYIFLIFVQSFFFHDNAGSSLRLDAMLARAPVKPFTGDGSLPRLYRRLA